MKNSALTISAVGVLKIILQNEESLCLSDYYTIFRCDVLKRPKKSLKSLNPLSWGSGTIKQKNKKIINEQ
ncbi:unnamed protein product [Rotaria sordida]|uniref:Uncharacterized protein n=1 Tax=Rotaria sordida TaxID=392033 RepID=A0A815ENF0_9BILA|nr:unnamed protein product [Rotaria sordida]